MSDFAVLAWREDAAVRAKDIKERLAADTQWRLVIDAAHMAVFLSRERPLPLLRLPGVTGVVMGSVFDTAEANAGRGQLADLTWLCGDSPTALCRRLSREAWGSYVAVLPDGDGAPNVPRRGRPADSPRRRPPTTRWSWRIRALRWALDGE